MTAVMFPVGHYAGAIGASDHTVRVGTDQHRLTDREFGWWMVTHGPVDAEAQPWHRNQVIAQAQQLGLGDDVQPLAELEARGLVITVDQPAVIRSYRLCPLMIGLGQRRIGVPEAGPVAVLDADSYELWQWTATAPSLWATCELRSSVTGLDPYRAVDGLLRDLRILVVHGCGYLDVVG